MTREGGSRIEHYADPTAAVSEREIADFVRAHESDPRLTAGFDFEISRGTFRHNFRDLLPYFEEECARTGAADLHKVRLMTHCLDKRTRIQSDLPETTIIAILNRLEAENLAEAVSNRQDDDEISDIRSSWNEDIADYSGRHDLEPALRRMESAIARLDEEIGRMQEVQGRDLPATLETEDKVREKKERLMTLRAARSTLLEQYLSMH